MAPVHQRLHAEARPPNESPAFGSRLSDYGIDEHELRLQRYLVPSESHCDTPSCHTSIEATCLSSGPLTPRSTCQSHKIGPSCAPKAISPRSRRVEEAQAAAKNWKQCDQNPYKIEAYATNISSLSQAGNEQQRNNGRHIDQRFATVRPQLVDTALLKKPLAAQVGLRLAQRSILDSFGDTYVALKSRKHTHDAALKRGLSHIDALLNPHLRARNVHVAAHWASLALYDQTGAVSAACDQFSSPATLRAARYRTECDRTFLQRPAGHETHSSASDHSFHSGTQSLPNATWTSSISGYHPNQRLEPGGDGSGQQSDSATNSPPNELSGGYRCVVLGHDCPEERNDCRMNNPKEYVSQLRKHHESHDFFYCLKCLRYFDSAQMRDGHSECAEVCVTIDCPNYRRVRHSRIAACRHRHNDQVSIWFALSRLYHKDFRLTVPELMTGTGDQLSSRRRPRSLLSRGSPTALTVAGPSRHPHPSRTHLTVPAQHTPASTSETSSSTSRPDTLLLNAAAMSRVISAVASALAAQGHRASLMHSVDAIGDVHEQSWNTLTLICTLLSASQDRELLRSVLAALSAEDRDMARVVSPNFAEVLASWESDSNDHNYPSFPDDDNTVPGLRPLRRGDEVPYAGMAPFVGVQSEGGATSWAEFKDIDEKME